jgi:DNA-binding transcriptional LysR family regulator
MISIEEIETTLRQAALKIDNGATMMGEGVSEALPVMEALFKEAYRSGGEESVHDLANHLGAGRLWVDICGLMVAHGLRDVLITSGGRGDWKAEPAFVERIVEVMRAGHHTASRGWPEENPDKLSWARHAGIRVIEGRDL